MKVSLFNYHLPPELIAQQPLARRDQARLLELDKKSGQLRHYKFSDLTKLLQAGDVLVFNNSKVIPARLLGNKPSGGQVEIFLLKQWLLIAGNA
jgi:S-adenosylmethionine:tRNA ribosyltransferase-isomerase